MRLSRYGSSGRGVLSVVRMTGIIAKRRCSMKRMTVLCVAGSLWLLTGGLGYAQTTDKGNSGERQTLHKRSHSQFNAPHHRLEGARVKGSRDELSFEVLRMLSTGMSKAEVLSHAGPPQHTFQHNRSSAWVYSTADHWIVELTFGGGRVSAINWTRP